MADPPIPTSFVTCPTEQWHFHLTAHTPASVPVSILGCVWCWLIPFPLAWQGDLYTTHSTGMRFIRKVLWHVCAPLCRSVGCLLSLVGRWQCCGISSAVAQPNQQNATGAVVLTPDFPPAQISNPRSLFFHRSPKPPPCTPL